MHARTDTRPSEDPSDSSKRLGIPGVVLCKQTKSPHSQSLSSTHTLIINSGIDKIHIYN